MTERTWLSKEEHDRRAAADLCFDCGEPGHKANACPHKRTVSGSGPLKPPGKVSSYSMELGGILRELQALADTTKHVDMLTLASACLDMESDNESYQWLGSEDLDLPPLEDIDENDELIPDLDKIQ